MDAADLARWTRFAAKGGIGKCTALMDCVAEGAQDLMFLKDDEIVVLMHLPDQGKYLGYCEGVVGHFSGSDVRFHSKLKMPVLTKSSSHTASPVTSSPVVASSSLSSKPPSRPISIASPKLPHSRLTSRSPTPVANTPLPPESDHPGPRRMPSHQIQASIASSVGSVYSTPDTPTREVTSPALANTRPALQRSQSVAQSDGLRARLSRSMSSPNPIPSRSPSPVHPLSLFSPPTTTPLSPEAHSPPLPSVPVASMSFISPPSVPTSLPSSPKAASAPVLTSLILTEELTTGAEPPPPSSPLHPVEGAIKRTRSRAGTLVGAIRGVIGGLVGSSSAVPPPPVPFIMPSPTAPSPLVTSTLPPAPTMPTVPLADASPALTPALSMAPVPSPQPPGAMPLEPDDYPISNVPYSEPEYGIGEADPDVTVLPSQGEKAIEEDEEAGTALYRSSLYSSSTYSVGDGAISPPFAYDKYASTFSDDDKALSTPLREEAGDPMPSTDASDTNVSLEEDGEFGIGLSLLQGMIGQNALNMGVEGIRGSLFWGTDRSVTLTESEVEIGYAQEEEDNPKTEARTEEEGTELGHGRPLFVESPTSPSLPVAEGDENTMAQPLEHPLEAPTASGRLSPTTDSDESDAGSEGESGYWEDIYDQYRYSRMSMMPRASMAVSVKTTMSGKSGKSGKSGFSANAGGVGIGRRSEESSKALAHIQSDDQPVEPLPQIAAQSPTSTTSPTSPAFMRGHGLPPLSIPSPSFAASSTPSPMSLRSPMLASALRQRIEAEKEPSPNPTSYETAFEDTDEFSDSEVGEVIKRNDGEGDITSGVEHAELPPVATEGVEAKEVLEVPLPALTSAHPASPGASFSSSLSHSQSSLSHFPEPPTGLPHNESPQLLAPTLSPFELASLQSFAFPPHPNAPRSPNPSAAGTPAIYASSPTSPFDGRQLPPNAWRSSAYNALAMVASATHSPQPQSPRTIHGRTDIDLANSPYPVPITFVTSAQALPVQFSAPFQVSPALRGDLFLSSQASGPSIAIEAPIVGAEGGQESGIDDLDPGTLDSPSKSAISLPHSSPVSSPSRLRPRSRSFSDFVMPPPEAPLLDERSQEEGSKIARVPVPRDILPPSPTLVVVSSTNEPSSPARPTPPSPLRSIPSAPSLRSLKPSPLALPANTMSASTVASPRSTTFNMSPIKSMRANLLGRNTQSPSQPGQPPGSPLSSLTRRMSGSSPRYATSEGLHSPADPSDREFRPDLGHDSSLPSPLARDTSLRSKVSVSALRGKNALGPRAGSIDISSHPGTPVTPLGFQYEETVHVQNMEFEIIRPVIARRGSPGDFRASEDGSSGDSPALSREGLSTAGDEGGWRSPSPAVSGRPSFVSRRGQASFDLAPSVAMSTRTQHKAAGAHTSIEAQRASYRALELKWIATMGAVPSKGARKSKKIKKLVQEGVPSSVRGVVWLYLTDSKARRMKGLYTQLTKRGRVPASDDILKDASTCFPEQKHLREESGPLILLLQAYLGMVPDLVYEKSLTVIAGRILLLSPEEDAFWTFVALMDNYLRGYFSPASMLIEVDSTLFGKALQTADQALAQRLFGDLSITPVELCRTWFPTLFSDTLPEDYLERVWDFFLYEGTPFLFRLGFAVLSLCRPFLMDASRGLAKSDVLSYLVQPSASLFPADVNQFIASAFAARVKDDDLRKLRPKVEAQLKHHRVVSR